MRAIAPRNETRSNFLGLSLLLEMNFFLTFWVWQALFFDPSKLPRKFLNYEISRLTLNLKVISYKASAYVGSKFWNLWAYAPDEVIICFFFPE